MSTPDIAVARLPMRAKPNGPTLHSTLYIGCSPDRRAGSRKLFFPRCRLLDSPASADIRDRPAETRIGKDRSGRGVIAGVRILCRVRASEAEIGRAHVGTPVTNAQRVCSL